MVLNACHLRSEEDSVGDGGGEFNPVGKIFLILVFGVSSSLITIVQNFGFRGIPSPQRRNQISKGRIRAVNTSLKGMCSISF